MELVTPVRECCKVTAVPQIKITIFTTNSWTFTKTVDDDNVEDNDEDNDEDFYDKEIVREQN